MSILFLLLFACCLLTGLLGPEGRRRLFLAGRSDSSKLLRLGIGPVSSIFLRLGADPGSSELLRLGADPVFSGILRLGTGPVSSETLRLGVSPSPSVILLLGSAPVLPGILLLTVSSPSCETLFPLSCSDTLLPGLCPDTLLLDAGSCDGFGFPKLPGVGLFEFVRPIFSLSSMLHLLFEPIITTIASYVINYFDIFLINIFLAYSEGSLHSFYSSTSVKHSSLISPFSFMT